jgi:hypothetical protein
MSLVRDRLIRYVGGLRFPYLVALTAAIFVVNLVVPDIVPYVDEILLGLVTIMLSRLKRPGASPPIERKP